MLILLLNSFLILFKLKKKFYDYTSNKVEIYTVKELQK